MGVKVSPDFRPVVPGAFRGGLSRTSFYDGMVLTEQDMVREQLYWRTKRQLTNRALGQGAVWGLALSWDEKTRCFRLSPGYGLSCCGDDLVVECPETVCERDLVDPCSEDFRRLFANEAERMDCDAARVPAVEASVMLEYAECPEDPRQAYEDACAEKVRGCRYGAMRETTRLRLVPRPAPRPPSPVDLFCAKIRKLLPAESQAALSHADTAMLSVVGLDGDAQEAAQAPIDLGKVGNTTLTAAQHGQYRVTIAPQVGWIVTEVKGLQNASSPLETIMGVSLTLGDGAQELDLTFEPLAGPGDTIAVKAKVRIERAADAPTRVSVEVISVERRPRPDGCSSGLEAGLLLEGGSCAVRALALAALIGWFRQELGSPACSTGPKTAPDPSRLALAWTISRLAWQGLFKVDITQANLPNFDACLEELFRLWCDGFHYKGPRCDTHQHGVILGGVRISRDGRILCFDEWADRRHVLTGPLLTHWGSQFGLAPLDVVAGRLASWICCLARVRLEKPDMAFMSALGMMKVGSGAVGRQGDLGPLQMHLTGLKVETSKPVGPREFLLRMLRLLTLGEDVSLASVRSADAYSIPGLNLHLVEPRQAPPPPRERMMGFKPAVERETASAPVTLRRAAEEFSGEVVRMTRIASLKTAADDAILKRVIGGLDSRGIATLEDLGSVDPVETARALLADFPDAAEAEAADRKFAELVNTAETAAVDAAKSVMAAADKAAAAAAASGKPPSVFIRGDVARFTNVELNNGMPKLANIPRKDMDEIKKRFA
jgi:hypothetical protein